MIPQGLNCLTIQNMITDEDINESVDERDPGNFSGFLAVR